MNKLSELIVEIAGKNDVTITDATDLISDLGYDSLKVIQLVSAIEEVFSIEFDIDEIDIDKIRTLHHLNALVEQKSL